MAKIILDFEKKIYDLEARIGELKTSSELSGYSVDAEVESLSQKLNELIRETFSNLSRWQRVQLARHPDRPYTLDYIQRIITDWVELHGDRQFGDDKSIIGGIGLLDGMGVMIIGHQKGRNVKENMKRNYGMPHPEGYRKALRLMKMAEKLKKPVITIIDTPGAYPGIEAEERGQSEAIARNLLEMSRLRTPVINMVIGEGASGGALGIGIGDRLLMLENTWYSVISPEGCASILLRDASKAKEAAEAMRVTAQDMLELGVADRIIEEPLGGAHRHYDETALRVRQVLSEELKQLTRLSTEELLKRRYKKIAAIGVYSE
ncbi:MAG TPA: acetyl-CoA carboxylase carboxyltransferase subunit alpha [Candidatus Marinimicrobia bacterium]|nr:acetyl-CoA carboxylase carboxyltransferase subunit alpha [Candidatus Neomarinimicrobiota bacterium]